MADYQGNIRLTLQGLKQINELDAALESSASNAERLAGTRIGLRVTGAEGLGRLGQQMSELETRATRLAAAVSRVGSGASTITLKAKVDRASINKELDLVSAQFRRRNWKLNVNDTTVKTARIEVEKTREALERLVSKQYVINVDYRYRNPPGGGRAGGRPPRPTGGPSPADIGRMASDAMAGGLSGQLYSGAVGQARDNARRQALIDRFNERVQRPQSPGGINQALAQRYIKALGGSAPKGMSPQGLATEVRRLLREVDASVIDSITQRVDELRLQMQQPRIRGIFRPKARGTSIPTSGPAFNFGYMEPNWGELMDRMAANTRNPAGASRILRGLPRGMVTTDLAGLATDQANGMFGSADPLGEHIRELGREAGLASSPLERISDAFRNAGAWAARVIGGLRSASGGGGSGGGGPMPPPGGGGNGGFVPFGLLPPSRFRPSPRPVSADLASASFVQQAQYQALTNSSSDQRRSDVFLRQSVEDYARSLVDAEQAQRSLNADIAAARSAVQDVRQSYLALGAGGTMTADQVRGVRSAATRRRAATFNVGQRALLERIDDLESQQAPFQIFRNYGELQGLYGQLPVTQRRGRLRNLQSNRTTAFRSVASESLIGGAFPLLFGQGLGTAAGGAIGGLASLAGPGAGFAGGLVGSAIGMQIDALVGSMTSLASSLNSPNEAMAALEASGFKVSNTLKFQVEQLQAVGRAYDAQSLVLQEVERRLGAGSVQELNALDAEQKRLEESWSMLTARARDGLIPALTGAVQVLNLFVSALNSLPEPPDWLKEASASAALGAALPQFPLVGPLAARALRGVQERGRAAVAAAPAGRPLTPQEAFADETARIQESRRQADLIQNAYRESFKLQRQAYDLQFEGAKLNRDMADYVYNKQKEILDLQMQVREQEIANTRGAQQNAIEGQDLSARETFASAVGFEQQLLTNVREVMRTRKEGEADIEQGRSRLEIALAKLQRDVDDYSRTTAREIEDIERRKLAYIRSVEDYKMQVADYQLQRAREAADLMRQAMSQGSMGGATGGLASAVDRIGGAYQFRSSDTNSSYINRLGFSQIYQSDPRENKFFDQRPALIAGAKSRIASLTQSDMAALAFTVLTEAGPTDIGKMDVAANLLLRSANLGNAPISAVAKQPNQYEGVFGYSRNQIEDPAFGRQRFGSRYDQTLNLLRSGAASAGAMPGGSVALTGRTGIGSGPHLDVRWADGRPITKEDADRFIRVAGRAPSSFGVTSGYGPRRAPVPGASTFHRGIDFGTPEGLPVALQGGAMPIGSMTEAQSGGGGKVLRIMTPNGEMRLLHMSQVPTGMQAATASQMSSIAQPRFNETSLGATPSAAPLNAERLAVAARAAGSMTEAQRILEEQIKLRQKGIELAQVEAILQTNQVPALEQESAALQDKLKARQMSIGIADEEIALLDLQAESSARIAQIEKERSDALAKAGKQYTGADLVDAQRMINEQSRLGLDIAKAEEEQKRKNLQVQNQIAKAEEARNLLINARREREVAEVESAALLRGELNASAVELARLSDGYKAMNEQQQAAYLTDVAKTEELRKQAEIIRGTNQISNNIRFVGAGLRAGRIGAEARGFEEVMSSPGGTPELANQRADAIRLEENQRLIWENLEKDIVAVSDAISGGLTRGLADIVTGARDIREVGREVLDSIAGTFLDSAQQQLSVILQRQIAGSLGGEGGFLSKIMGSGPEVATQQAHTAAMAAHTQALLASAANSIVPTGSALGSLGSVFGGGVPDLLGSVFGAANPISSVFSSGVGNFSGAFGGTGPIASILPSIVSGFGGFLAEGGDAQAGKAYWTGEKEPELFIPGVSGRVVPRSKINKALQLEQISDQEEKQEIDVRYEVKEIAGERYVTEQQFRKGMARAAKQGSGMAQSSMRNSGASRSYVGLP